VILRGSLELPICEGLWRFPTYRPKNTLIWLILDYRAGVKVGSSSELRISSAVGFSQLNEALVKSVAT
jgi:hypothetical protein